MSLFSKHTNALRWFGFVAVWLALDQITKRFAVTMLKPVGYVSVLGDFLRLTYAENRGMAFSISIFPPWFLTSIAIGAAIVLSYQLWKHPEPVFRNVCLSLILAGAAGNVFDRIHYGYVIDFIDCDFPDFIMNRWPVFNFADSGITVGVVMFGIYSIFEKPKPDTVQEKPTVNSSTTSDHPV